VRHMSVQMEQVNGTIVCDLQSGNFELQADRTHLMNALYNLMDNAIKYADKLPEIKISTHDETGNTVIIIQDNGPGIPKAFHEKIFEKYFRIPTGNIHNVKGFGLGLAYVKQIVELHNGTISMESEKEKGTKFTIKLLNV
jgi:two-component system phosphate regulon sensor histidine kinase PhoR